MQEKGSLFRFSSIFLYLSKRRKRRDKNQTFQISSIQISKHSIWIFFKWVKINYTPETADSPQEHLQDTGSPGTEVGQLHICTYPNPRLYLLIRECIFSNKLKKLSNLFLSVIFCDSNYNYLFLHTVICNDIFFTMYCLILFPIICSHWFYIRDFYINNGVFFNVLEFMSKLHLPEGHPYIYVFLWCMTRECDYIVKPN